MMMKSVRLTMGLTVLLLCAATCGRSPRQLAEHEFASRVKSTFGLSLPCSLAWCDSYLDGGSVGGVLVGAQADSLRWAWGPGSTPMPLPPDAIMRDPAAMNAWGDSVAQSIRRRAFVGAKEFSDPGATPLPIGSPEESLFVQLLWTAVMRDSVSMSKRGPEGKGLMAAYVARMLETQRARVGKESPAARGQAD